MSTNPITAIPTTSPDEVYQTIDALVEATDTYLAQMEEMLGWLDYSGRYNEARNQRETINNFKSAVKSAVNTAWERSEDSAEAPLPY